MIVDRGNGLQTVKSFLWTIYPVRRRGRKEKNKKNCLLGNLWQEAEHLQSIDEGQTAHRFGCCVDPECNIDTKNGLLKCADDGRGVLGKTGDRSHLRFLHAHVHVLKC